MGFFSNKKQRNLQWYINLLLFLSIWVGGGFGIASSWLSDSPVWVFIIACIGMGLHIALFIYDWIMDAYFPFSPYSPFYYLLNYKKIDSSPRDGVITWYSKLGLLTLSALWTVVPLVNIILNIKSGNTKGVGFAFAILQIIIAATSCFVLLFYNIVLCMEFFLFLFYSLAWIMTCWCPFCKCLPTPTMSSTKANPLYLVYLCFFKAM